MIDRRRAKNGHWYFVVEGSGHFAFDMLRYDQCWPVSEGHDTSQLDGFHMEPRRVLLATDTQCSPTPDRWRSFGWTVSWQGRDRHAIERQMGRFS